MTGMGEGTNGDNVELVCCPAPKTHKGWNRNQPDLHTLFCARHALDTDIQVLMVLSGTGRTVDQP